MKVDINRLSALITDRFRLVRVFLSPINVQCAWPVYKAISDGYAPMFVKVTKHEAAKRTLAFLNSSIGCPFLPRPICEDVLDYDGFAVLCLEWKEACRVDAENMTDGQLNGFIEGCWMLSNILSRYTGPLSPLAEDDLIDEQYNIIRGYVNRHPFVGCLLKQILSIPEAERSYSGHLMSTIHGDLQSKNYGFDGDRLAAVYDTDDLTEGLACEDACYAFTERARRSELSTAKRRRLTDLFLRLVELSPWPKDEWLIAVNHSRLRIAARRLANHPDSVFIAFDIARRDKPLRMLEQALKGASC